MDLMRQGAQMVSGASSAGGVIAPVGGPSAIGTAAFTGAHRVGELLGAIPKVAAGALSGAFDKLTERQQQTVPSRTEPGFHAVRQGSGAVDIGSGLPAIGAVAEPTQPLVVHTDQARPAESVAVADGPTQETAIDALRTAALRYVEAQKALQETTEMREASMIADAYAVQFAHDGKPVEFKEKVLDNLADHPDVKEGFDKVRQVHSDKVEAVAAASDDLVKAIRTANDEYLATPERRQEVDELVAAAIEAGKKTPGYANGAGEYERRPTEQMKELLKQMADAVKMLVASVKQMLGLVRTDEPMNHVQEP
jgi:hypothetical protein